jgi:hypothetical protein
MRIKDLPGGGTNFRASVGAGNFSQKLSAATRAGGLSNLTDNKKGIIKAVKHYEKAIRQGKFDSYRQRTAWQMVKNSSENLSKNDEKEIKSLFKHLSKASSGVKESESKAVIQKALDKDSSFTEERAKEMKAKMGRFSRVRSGGESSLKFSSQPKDTSEERMSASGKLLERRFLQKEKMFKDRLPRQRVEWQKEKEKRLEVSSLERDMNKKPDSREDKSQAEKKKNEAWRPFQNL